VGPWVGLKRPAYERISANIVAFERNTQVGAAFFVRHDRLNKHSVASTHLQVELLPFGLPMHW
jgi:hypothetical protein